MPCAASFSRILNVFDIRRAANFGLAVQFNEGATWRRRLLTGQMPRQPQRERKGERESICQHSWRWRRRAKPKLPVECVFDCPLAASQSNFSCNSNSESCSSPASASAQHLLSIMACDPPPPDHLPLFLSCLRSCSVFAAASCQKSFSSNWLGSLTAKAKSHTHTQTHTHTCSHRKTQAFSPTQKHTHSGKELRIHMHNKFATVQWATTTPRLQTLSKTRSHKHTHTQAHTCLQLWIHMQQCSRVRNCTQQQQSDALKSMLRSGMASPTCTAGLMLIKTFGTIN